MIARRPLAQRVGELRARARNIRHLVDDYRLPSFPLHKITPRAATAFERRGRVLPDRPPRSRRAGGREGRAARIQSSTSRCVAGRGGIDGVNP